MESFYELNVSREYLTNLYRYLHSYIGDKLIITDRSSSDSMKGILIRVADYEDFIDIYRYAEPIWGNRLGATYSLKDLSPIEMLFVYHKPESK